MAPPVAPPASRGAARVRAAGTRAAGVPRDAVQALALHGGAGPGLVQICGYRFPAAPPSGVGSHYPTGSVDSLRLTFPDAATVRTPSEHQEADDPGALRGVPPAPERHGASRAQATPGAAPEASLPAIAPGRKCRAYPGLAARGSAPVHRRHHPLGAACRDDHRGRLPDPHRAHCPDPFPEPGASRRARHSCLVRLADSAWAPHARRLARQNSAGRHRFHGAAHDRHRRVPHRADGTHSAPAPPIRHWAPGEPKAPFQCHADRHGGCRCLKWPGPRANNYLARP